MQTLNCSSCGENKGLERFRLRNHRRLSEKCIKCLNDQKTHPAITLKLKLPRKSWKRITAAANCKGMDINNYIIYLYENRKK